MKGAKEQNSAQVAKERIKFRAACGCAQADGRLKPRLEEAE